MEFEKEANVHSIQCEYPDIKDIFKADFEVIVKNEGFITYEIETKRIEADGGNYMADLYESSIKGVTKDGPKELHLFIKNKIYIPNMAITADDAYSAESTAYKVLFSMINELEEQFNVPQADKYRYIKYYNTENENVIIMENMAKQGYKVLNRYESLPLDYAEKAIKELAKFNALAFAIEKHRPEFHADVVLSFKSMNNFGETFMTFLDNSAKRSLELIESEENRNRLEKVIFDLIENLPKQFVRRDDCVNCLSHNDYRVNNILYKEDDGRITDLIPLDYQLLGVRCPINDFFYLLLLSTNQKFRRQNMDYLKEFYYSNLAKYLEYYKLDIINVYPKKRFEQDYQTSIFEFGLPMALTVLPFILTPEDNFPDLKSNTLSELTIPNFDLHIERLNELVEDFIQWGYL